MAWSAPMTAVDGHVFSAAEFNQYVSDNLAYLKTEVDTLTTETSDLRTDVDDLISSGAVPTGRALVRKTSTQSVADSSNIRVTFPSATYDDSGLWDGANNQFVIPSGLGGLWLINGAVSYQTNSSGNRGCDLYVNSTRVGSTFLAASNNISQRLPHSVPQVLSDGDVVYLQGWQSSGGALNVLGDANNPTYLSVTRIQG